MEEEQKPAQTEKAPVSGDKDVEENKIWGILAYFWILSVVVVATKKNSPFAMYHAKQGLVIFALSIVNSVLQWIIPLTIWYTISWIISLALFVLAIIGIIYAAQGQKKEVPLIGQIAKKINF